MRRVVSVILLLLGACAPLAFSVDPKFSPSDLAEIQRAADDWNARTKPDHQITFDGARWHIVKQAPVSGYNGETDSNTRTILIRPEHPGVSTYAVALHEFGHALGLHHTQTGVMMPFTVSVEFTPEVMAECQRAGACK